MAQIHPAQPEPVSAANPHTKQHSMWRKIFGQGNGTSGKVEHPDEPPGSTNQSEVERRPSMIRRVSRKVVPGLPRAQTFKRQLDEVRNNLEPVQPEPAERRTVSVDRRLHASQTVGQHPTDPRISAPDFQRHDMYGSTVSAPSTSGIPRDDNMMESIGELSLREMRSRDESHAPETESNNDAASITTSHYDAMIHEELERIWILNLSMHFRDKSKREKFFVTYREKDMHWRRVTISLDYRNAPDNSLEMDLHETKFQRDKSAKIYEAIRESLPDIQFYETVTNLKLQTTDGRLHVHVVEDVNEIIHYPTVRMIQHLRCRRVRESEIDFDSHMSGFVYKVGVDGEALIKKEIPGPDTVDEFLYEINALSRLSNSRNVIQFYGVVVDDYEEHVKGLLISFADKGALIDVIFDYDHNLEWARRERWARQIVEGLSEIHEAGFVQGDFTLSNIVIDYDDNAKIIDINRRGCPVGWEPPEATPLIESNQRISMYIGVKSDLYQLGMVLWALAEQEDEPEHHGRPLRVNDGLEVPDWYKTVVRICLAEDPRHRMQAVDLLRLFPQGEAAEANKPRREQPSISVDDGHSIQEYVVEGYQSNGRPVIRTIHSSPEWTRRGSFGHTYVDSPTGMSNEPYYFPTRGRSPPSPEPSNLGYCEPRYNPSSPTWEDVGDHSFDNTRTPSESEIAPEEFISRAEEQISPPQTRESSRQVEARAAEQPAKNPPTEDNFATPKHEEDPGEGQKPHSRTSLEKPPNPPKAFESPGERPALADTHEQQTQGEPKPQNGHPGDAGIEIGAAQEVRGEEGVDSAIEMKLPAQLPEPRSRPETRHRSSASIGTANVRVDILGIGSGHVESDDAATRRQDDSDVGDDLLAGL
ncbi:Activated CDC42 kinase 1 [Cytospora mali]|uniref:Activated CDC42 kinase 1 n=1 Tax=Cytospora mali TaxID=578113 RepID=A0A194UQB5_CYTMA|nr:Activated CDC42 kinase 1 [Valsa mali var. pyri (nom. inval.)]